MLDGENNKGEHPTGETASPIRYTVRPGIASQIVLKTLPRAVCILHQEGEPDPKHSLRLHADQDGMIHFYVHPSGESEDPIKVVIECEGNGEVTRYLLELRASSQPTPAFPALAPQGPTPHRKGASIRPGLSEDEMLHLPDEELLNRGYPPRPAPEEMPEAFHAWRRVVSVPATMFEPQLVPRPEIVQSFARTSPTQDMEKTEESEPTVEAGITETTSNFWSGLIVDSAPGTFETVYGTWVVPRVSGDFTYDAYSSIWVGLDGYNFMNPAIMDLVQAGTMQESLCIASNICVIYQDKSTVSQKTCHAAKRFQRMGFLS